MMLLTPLRGYVLFLHFVAAGFGLPAGPLQLRCVRLASKERHKDLAAFFPAQCVAAIDDDSGGAGGGTAAV